jgi:methylenetetrahydrofolate reductase (NADPH)
MGATTSVLQQRIDSGKPVLVAELSPPQGIDAGAVREVARRLKGKVHAVGVSDNRDHVCMSALAAATLVAGEGVEPILHVVTRDRNRVALVSDLLGAEALGVRNVLCTSGTHQTLGDYRQARNVFDLDAVQLLQTYAGLGQNASVVGAASLAVGPVCLGAVVSPFSDPAELQLMKLEKKIQAGAKFVITQPVFDLERFEAWWGEVTKRGLQKKTAILAGIRPLASAEAARSLASARPKTLIPDALVSRMTAKTDAAAQRAEGVAIAVETIRRLAKLPGLRGFEVCADGQLEAALEVIQKSAVEIN